VTDDIQIKEVEARRIAGGVSDTTFAAWRKKGLIPQPIRRGRDNYYWKRELIEALSKSHPAKAS